MRFLPGLLLCSSIVAAAPRLVTKTEIVVKTVYVTAQVPEATYAPSHDTPANVPSPDSSTSSAYIATPAAPPSPPSPPPVPSPAPPAAPSSAPPAPPAAVPSPSPAAAHSSTQEKGTTDDTPVKAASSDTILNRMSNAEVDAIYKTCWGGSLVWPLPDTLPPVEDVVSPQLSIFTRPDSTANTLTVHNYCGYDIYFNHLAGATSLETGTLSAGTSISRPLTGSVFKSSKSKSMAQDLLVEYNVADDGQLWYNLSLITCLGSTGGLPDSDTSACAGHEAGLQLGNKNSMSFQCAAGAWCDDQAYLYKENLCKKQNPVTTCSPSNGLTMEFCASNKK